MKKAFKIIGAVIAVAGVVAAAYYFISKHMKKKDNCTCEECEDICCFDEDDACECADDESVEIEEDEPAEE